MPNMLNGDSMKSPRLFSICTGRTMLLKSNPMEDQAMFESPQVSTQDGGNSSDQTVLSSLMIKERSSMFKVLLMLKTETLLFTPNMERSTNNGILSTLINTQKSQRRVSSTKTSVSMLKDHSTLSQKWDKTDILISSTTETWSSRLRMVETPKSGGSIKDH
jgi:hypothetical protein